MITFNNCVVDGKLINYLQKVKTTLFKENIDLDNNKSFSF